MEEYEEFFRDGPEEDGEREDAEAGGEEEDDDEVLPLPAPLLPLPLARPAETRPARAAGVSMGLPFVGWHAAGCSLSVSCALCAVGMLHVAWGQGLVSPGHAHGQWPGGSGSVPGAPCCMLYVRCISRLACCSCKKEP